MAASSSSLVPTPLDHADDEEEGHMRGGEGSPYNGAQRNLVYITPRVHLLEVFSKFKERYSCKTMLGSRNSDNVERRGWNERRMSNADDSRRKWRNSGVLRRPNNGRNDYRGNYEKGRQGNQWFDSRKRFQKDDRRFNDKGYQFKNGGQNDDFSRGNSRNREVRERILVKAIGGKGVY
ncbi:uncharacterized protein TNCV_209081 [Trichonephila clavipes]|uniref:Uncharacterized protein n=1 Tax=Trichonephila clavipes TaxID=2585209 RepID=A0A8X6SVP7_TRICX|nr:uncharacterized protein TNCV_209081 [Trichonephila clavipes]